MHCKNFILVKFPFSVSWNDFPSSHDLLAFFLAINKLHLFTGVFPCKFIFLLIDLSKSRRSLYYAAILIMESSYSNP